MNLVTNKVSHHKIILFVYIFTKTILTKLPCMNKSVTKDSLCRFDRINFFDDYLFLFCRTNIRSFRQKQKHGEGYARVFNINERNIDIISNEFTRCMHNMDFILSIYLVFSLYKHINQHISKYRFTKNESKRTIKNFTQ